jgi:uncharacterized protein YnzC (UPF0291/DUF896 family)
MGMMDDMKDKMGGMSKDQIKDRISELSNQEKAGDLTDKGREELNMLRSKL